MCVICIKPAGELFPTEERFKAMFESNSDGAGFMFYRDKKVVIRKGMMKLKHLRRAMAQENLTENDTVIFHFRIATAGSVSPQNCHPFPISEKVNELKSLRIETDLAMAHNGILDYVADKEHDLSDTMTFIKEVVSQKHIRKTICEVSTYSLLEMAIGSSKMVFFDSKGSFILMGDWVKDTTANDKLLYSNLYFKWREEKKNDITMYNTYGEYGNNWYNKKNQTEIEKAWGKDGDLDSKVIDGEYSKIEDRRSNFATQQENDIVSLLPGETKCPNCGYEISEPRHLCCTKCGKIFYRVHDGSEGYGHD